jgi:5-keto 4-deoxyuronate isomerase
MSVFATAAMAGEKWKRKTDFSSSGEIAQGAVHESLLPADHSDDYVAIFQILRERNLTNVQGVLGCHDTGKYVRKNRFATNALWNTQPCHCDDRVHPSAS